MFRTTSVFLWAVRFNKDKGYIYVEADSAIEAAELAKEIYPGVNYSVSAVKLFGQIFVKINRGEKDVESSSR